jgi:hypothetical protein
MSQQPIHLLTIARTRPLAIEQSENLAPNFTYAAVIDFPHYSPDNLQLILNTLNPSPKGVVVGGGVSIEVQQEVEQIVKLRNESREKGEKLKLVCIPLVTKEKVGVDDFIRVLRVQDISVERRKTQKISQSGLDNWLK